MQIAGKRQHLGGTKMKTGKVLFDGSGHLAYFVGCCPECYGRVTMTRTEAELFARKLGFSKRKRRAHYRIAILRRYEAT